MLKHPQLMQRVIRSTFATAAILAVLLVSGCGDDVEDPPAQPETPPPASPAPVPRVD